MREAWEIQELSVIGVALSRIAAETLQASSGIPTQPLASHELEWQEGRNPLTLNHVIVVDGAEMIGLKQLERLLAVVDKARAKVLLMGDSAQLEAMGSMSPLQAFSTELARLRRRALRGRQRLVSKGGTAECPSATLIIDDGLPDRCHCGLKVSL